MSLDKPCPCGEDGPHGQHREDCPNRTHHLANCAILAGTTRAHGCTCGLRPSAKSSTSVKFLQDAELQARLDNAAKTLAELNAEVARRKSFTPGQKLADALHDLLHHHVDCDYYYSDWPQATGCRMRFLAHANTWLKVDTFGAAMDMVARFKKIRDA